MTLFIAVIGYSQTFTENFITYSVTSGNTVTVTNYNIAGGTNVVIPASVTQTATSKMSSSKSANNLMATYNVTGIAQNAFFSKGITSVVIPNSVLTIGSQAFAVNFLSSAVIGNGVTTIGFSAFFNNNLTSITIPNSVTTIDGRAFDDNLLTNVIIGNSVTSIGINAFRDNLLTCVSSLATIPPTVTTGANDSFGTNRSNINLTVPTGSGTNYATAQWTGFSTVTEVSGNTFIANNITYQITSTVNNTVTATNYDTAGGSVVNIPSTVTSACINYSVTVIGNGAFESNSLTSVTIPNSVTTINAQAFFNNNLTSITIPNSVTTIAHNAFGFNDLTSVTLSNNLITIATEVFRNNDITSIIIPDSVTSIGNGAFVQNNNMQTLVLGNSIETIGNFAFRFNNLNSVTIPDSVTSIGEYAFGENNIFTLNLGNGVETIGNRAFINNPIENVIIPNSVLTIGESAFFSNSNNRNNIVLGNSLISIGDGAFISGTASPITSITIPASVTQIGLNTFQIASLTDVTSLATMPATIVTGGNDTFGVRANIHLHIPAGTMGVYVTDSGALWTGFNPVTEDALLNTTVFDLNNEVSIITTSDNIKVIASNNLRLENYTIYNISGSKIASGIENEMPTSTLASGIYILKLDLIKELL
ncbi:MAG: leucine-rich repeat domain-containing protein [Flavobacterium sp.]|nr:leucine-rich repeat domain-containing protein [Flavobacterium sp.]